MQHSMQWTEGGDAQRSRAWVARFTGSFLGSSFFLFPSVSLPDPSLLQASGWTTILMVIKVESIVMNYILLIIGSPASGKSTTSKEITKRSSRGVHIPVDDLRTMVQGGIIHPGVPGWPPKLVQQLELARITAKDMALRYCKSDFLAARDGFWDPCSHLQEYASLIKRSNLTQVVLRPSVSAATARNHTRQALSIFRNALDDATKFVNTELGKHEETFMKQGWHIVDTSKDTIEESVVRILASLKSSAMGWLIFTHV